MSKIRVYELAKLFEKSNTEMVDILTRLGVKIKSHMSSIEDSVAKLVEDDIKDKKEMEGKMAVDAIATYPCYKNTCRGFCLGCG